MHIKIGYNHYLTTAHLEACKDGIPVLEIDGKVYRPDDFMPGSSQTVGRYVDRWLRRMRRRVWFGELFLKQGSEYKLYEEGHSHE